jgi:hypothetical protein
VGGYCKRGFVTSEREKGCRRSEPWLAKSRRKRRSYIVATGTSIAT